MDLVSPWHWDCAECGGPIARLCGKGPCQELHYRDFDRNGKPLPCGLEINISQKELKRLGVEDHGWNGGWVHTDPSGLCICGHPKHGYECPECTSGLGRFLALWHTYTPWEELQKDHEPMYRAEGIAA